MEARRLRDADDVYGANVVIGAADLNLLGPYREQIRDTYRGWETSGRLAEGCMVVQVGAPDSDGGSGFNATYARAAADWAVRNGQTDLAEAIEQVPPERHTRLVLHARVAVPRPGFSTYSTQVLYVTIRDDALVVDGPGPSPAPVLS